MNRCRNRCVSVLLLLALLVAGTTPCFAGGGKKVPETPYYLISRTSSQWGNYPIVSIGYYPSRKTCLRALVILQQETAVALPHYRPDAECVAEPAANSQQKTTVKE